MERVRNNYILELRGLGGRVNTVDSYGKFANTSLLLGEEDRAQVFA